MITVGYPVARRQALAAHQFLLMLQAALWASAPAWPEVRR